jgi:hypothetical protein
LSLPHVVAARHDEKAVLELDEAVVETPVTEDATAGAFAVGQSCLHAPAHVEVAHHNSLPKAASTTKAANMRYPKYLAYLISPSFPASGK